MPAPPGGMSEDYYATLGVAPTASGAEIERAYRRLARAYHPDLLRQASEETRRRAEERLKAINRAHHSLGDQNRRLAYDRARRAQQAVERPTATAVRPAPASAAPRPRAVRPVATRSTHRAGGGPIDLEWATAPPVVARPATDLFTVGRLLRYALLIVLFALALGLLWHPSGTSSPAPVPTTVATATAR